MITGFYAGIFGLMLIALVYNAIRLRTKHRVSLGDGNKPDLEKAIRAHGNFVEVVPFALILMFILETNQVSPWALYAYGTALVIARAAHAYSIYHSVLRARVFGMTLSLLLIAIGSVSLMAMYIL
jgi:uncharacterized membrane protein YecN with MAPEG domain